ncbi:hypothetical protein DFH08DRAFT_964696 [Mycena albidolilacea]|uniref:DUF6533 domain-containing protein n=1 Tax=Mycena albidolilacea TaxID=1033008 RepID=A0AAD7ELT8_9AGAR|nr:hypothetical protein DFH08DRAFT_964696 [Mycena albidolilacea]
MSDYQPLFEELQIVLAHTAVTHYAIASSLCLYAYELLLTFSAEVEYFWGSPWTFVKAVFFWASPRVLGKNDHFADDMQNRYFPIPAIAYVAFCKSAINRTPTLPLFILDVIATRFSGFAGEAVGIILSLVCIGGAQVIMQLRVHALYGQNRRLKIALSCLFIFEEANELAMMLTTGLEFLFAYPIPSMVFDTILLILVVYKTYLIQREETVDKSWTGVRLVRLMFRDSVMYFACTVGFNLFNLLIWILGPYDLFTAGTAWAVSVPVMAASRVLLNMRKTYYCSNTDTLDGEIGTEFQVARRPQGSKGPAVWSSSSSGLESGIDDV